VRGHVFGKCGTRRMACQLSGQAGMKKVGEADRALVDDLKAIVKCGGAGFPAWAGRTDSLSSVTQSVSPGEPTTSSVATTCREVDWGPGLGWIGASGCGVVAATYEGGFRGAALGQKERRGERFRSRSTGAETVSESPIAAFFILVYTKR
jgi:hypothetical protein